MLTTVDVFSKKDDFEFDIIVRLFLLVKRVTIGHVYHVFVLGASNY